MLIALTIEMGNKVSEWAYKLEKGVLIVIQTIPLEGKLYTEIQNQS